jgi:hypothetical protein
MFRSRAENCRFSRSTNSTSVCIRKEVSIDSLIAALIADPNLNELDVTSEIGPGNILSFYIPPSNLISHVYNRIIRIRGNRSVMIIAAKNKQES